MAKMFRTLENLLKNERNIFQNLLFLYEENKYLREFKERLYIRNWVLIMGITKPCTHLHPAHFNLHPAPPTSTQLILASTQLSATPSTIFEPKYCT